MHVILLFFLITLLTERELFTFMTIVFTKKLIFLIWVIFEIKLDSNNTFNKIFIIIHKFITIRQIKYNTNQDIL